MDTPSPRLKEIGPWSEQFSSSGKRYYYNRETEVSQWEKPAEWKQAEKDQAEQRVRSSTTGGTREDKSASSYKPRHRPSVSSTSIAAHSTSVSVKSVDSVGHSVRPTISSPSVLNSSTAPKRPRLDEQPSFSSQSNTTRHVPPSTAASSANNKKFLPSVAAPALSTILTSADHHQQQQRCASAQSVGRTEDENGSSRQNNCMRLPSKSVSTPLVSEEPKKGTLTAENSTKCQMDDQKLPPLKSSASASDVFASTTHRIGNANLKPSDNEVDQSEKLSQAPCDDMYTKFYHPEPGAVAGRRLLNYEEFLVNVKRCSDRKTKHANLLFAICRDLNSVQTLSKVAEFRSQLLKQRTAATSKRIQELESKSQ